MRPATTAELGQRQVSAPRICDLKFRSAVPQSFRPCPGSIASMALSAKLHAPQQRLRLFDDFVGADKQRWRYGDAERFLPGGALGTPYHADSAPVQLLPFGLP